MGALHCPAHWPLFKGSLPKPKFGLLLLRQFLLYVYKYFSWGWGSGAFKVWNGCREEFLFFFSFAFVLRESFY